MAGENFFGLLPKAIKLPSFERNWPFDNP